MFHLFYFTDWLIDWLIDFIYAVFLPPSTYTCYLAGWNYQKLIWINLCITKLNPALDGLISRLAEQTHKLLTRKFPLFFYTLPFAFPNPLCLVWVLLHVLLSSEYSYYNHCPPITDASKCVTRKGRKIKSNAI